MRAHGGFLKWIFGWRQQTLGVAQKEEFLECTVTTEFCLGQVG